MLKNVAHVAQYTKMLKIVKLCLVLIARGVQNAKDNVVALERRMET